MSASVDLDQRAVDLEGRALKDTTHKDYARAWDDFRDFCTTHGFTPLPATPATVQHYFGSLYPRLGYTAIRKRSAAIGRMHRELGYLHPGRDAAVRQMLSGLAHLHAHRRPRKYGLRTSEVRAMVDDEQAFDRTTLRAKRDVALVLCAFARHLSNEQIRAVWAENLIHTEEGLTITFPEQPDIHLAYGRHTESCPVRALLEWCTAAQIVRGPVFRRIDRWDNVRPEALSRAGIFYVLKLRLHAHHMPNESHYSFHSLKRGFVQSAAEAGLPLYRIQEITGRRNLPRLLRDVREAIPHGGSHVEIY